jgi:hypothetical protein
MKRPNITPGDWQKDRRASLRICGDNDRQVAACGGRSPNTETEQTEEENDANTRFIAAAPDMAKALEGCIQSLQHMPETDGAYKYTCIAQAKAALTKAGYTF